MPSRRCPAALKRGVGKRIRTLREEAGITQERLAWEAGPGISKAFLSQIETGKHTASLGTLNLLAKRLGVEIGDFLFFDLQRPRHRLMDALRRGDLEGARQMLERYRRS